LTNGLLRLKRGTLEIRIAVSREWIAQRTRELLAHTYGINLSPITFSTKFSTCVYTLKSQVVATNVRGHVRLRGRSTTREALHSHSWR
jgi:hypothetical protein